MPRNALIVADAAGPEPVAAGVLKRFGFAPPYQAPTVEGALGRLRDGHFDLVIVPLHELSPVQLAELDQLVRRERFSFVIGTAPRSDPELIVRGLRAGIHEFLVSPPDPSELSGAVDRLMRRVPAEVRRGQVFAVYSSKGGLGTTSVAVNLADAFARTNAESRVALADLAVAGGDVRVFLNLSPAYHMGDLVKKLDRADAELFYSLLTPTQRGIWVLPGPDDPELDDELDASTTGSMIDQLRQHFAFTVLDCEHHLSERTVAALDAADRIVLVTQLNVPSLRSMQRTFALCRQLGYPAEKLCVLVNRYKPDDVLTLKDASQVLTSEVAATLPNDYQLSSSALTQGVPVAQLSADGELARAYARVASKLAGSHADTVTTAARGQPGGLRLGRLFGLRKRA
ncbi:MAG: CpaE family protein [Gemmatimonadaceae bacterium]